MLLIFILRSHQCIGVLILLCEVYLSTFVLEVRYIPWKDYMDLVESWNSLLGVSTCRLLMYPRDEDYTYYLWNIQLPIILNIEIVAIYNIYEWISMYICIDVACLCVKCWCNSDVTCNPYILWVGYEPPQYS